MKLTFPVSITEMYTWQENSPQLITCIFSDFKCLHLKKYSVVTTKSKGTAFTVGKGTAFTEYSKNVLSLGIW